MPRRIRQKIYVRNKKIDLETVMHVARLARLNLTKKEAKKCMKDLNSILSAFEDLKNAKANVPPSFHPFDIRDVLRTDVAEECLKREKALANTRHKEAGFFKGPRAV